MCCVVVSFVVCLAGLGVGVPLCAPRGVLTDQDTLHCTVLYNVLYTTLYGILHYTVLYTTLYSTIYCTLDSTVI